MHHPRQLRSYLAPLMAFFQRDTARPRAHLEAGWVPRDTRVDELESAVRSVCEPIFDRPLKDIYFGRLMLQIFEVSRRFRMDIQPQLMLLQKTLLQVEGLGRQLDPDLDLRRAAQPVLERWISRRWTALHRDADRAEAPLGRTLPTSAPLHRVLNDDTTHRLRWRAPAGERADPPDPICAPAPVLPSCWSDTCCAVAPFPDTSRFDNSSYIHPLCKNFMPRF